MASAALIYNFNKIKKRLNVYEKSQAEFAAKKTLTRLGKEMRGRNSLIGQTYLGKLGFFQPFKNVAPFTKNSTFAVQKGLQLDVGVKDEKALKDGKGNPASKYLYPPIGGGSTRAYDTLFTQYLRNRNLINNGDYPFAVKDVLTKVGGKLNRRGRVTKSTFYNTMIGLAKTRDKEIKPRSSSNASIQDARVIALKSDTSKYKRGIYREYTPSSGKYPSFLRPLFMFKPIPTQKPQSTFKQRVKRIADDRVYKYWREEIKKLAKQ